VARAIVGKTIDATAIAQAIGQFRVIIERSPICFEL
jgi:hypothetical protein